MVPIASAMVICLGSHALDVDHIADTEDLLKRQQYRKRKRQKAKTPWKCPHLQMTSSMT